LEEATWQGCQLDQAREPDLDDESGGGGGIDTHKDLHVAAVIDTAETVFATHSFSTTRAGYRALVKWLRTSGTWPRSGWRAPAATEPGFADT
jgi:hypothetical protein